MSDAKVNTGERYMMVNMEYHEALKQQNAAMLAALEELTGYASCRCGNSHFCNCGVEVALTNARNLAQVGK